MSENDHAPTEEQRIAMLKDMMDAQVKYLKSNLNEAVAIAEEKGYKRAILKVGDIEVELNKNAKDTHFVLNVGTFHIEMDGGDLSTEDKLKRTKEMLAFLIDHKIDPHQMITGVNAPNCGDDEDEDCDSDSGPTPPKAKTPSYIG